MPPRAPRRTTCPRGNTSSPGRGQPTWLWTRHDRWTSCTGSSGSRCDRCRGQRRGGPARSVPGARRGAAAADAARGPDRDGAAVRRGMAARPGRRRLRPVRRGDRAVLADRGQVRTDRPGGSRYTPRSVPARAPAPCRPSRRSPAFRTGEGFGWRNTATMCSTGASGSSGPSTSATCCHPGCPRWTVSEKLTAGARVADVGCGLGAATVLMAKAYDESVFIGSDDHEGSIEQAEKRAVEAWGRRLDSVPGRVGARTSARPVRPGHHVRLPARPG